MSSISSSSTTAPSSSALLFTNARIIASPKDDTIYNWMIIDDGKVHSIGTGTPPSHNLTTHDLKNQLVLPGLIDAHIHVYLTGKGLCTVDLNASSSITELQSRVKSFIDKNEIVATEKNHVWVMGRGWEQDHLGRYPTRHDLDSISTSIPILLWRTCHHVCLVNTKALEIAGLNRECKDPDGGHIDRDEQGELTGILRETACHLVESLIPETPAQRRKYVETGLRHCLENGITSVQTNDEGCWPTYVELADENKLNQRVFLTIMQSEMDDGITPKAGTVHGPYLSCHRVKLFADGALGSETAALTLPYKHKCPHTHHSHKRAKTSTSPKSPESPNPADKCKGDVDDADDQDRYGILILRQAELAERVKKAHDAGYRIEMHVIGDRAAGIGLTALEQSGMTSTSRPILTHCQVLRADLLPRMKAIGVVANVQPQFVVTDSRWAEKALHDELLQYSYAWKTLLDYGIHVAGGSDSPVEYASPFRGMHAAIFRPEGSLIEQKTDEKPKINSWRPHECLTKQQALHLYTTGAAYASGSETTLGSLQPGYAADFVVLNVDVWSHPERMNDITKSEIDQIWVNGKKVLAKNS